MRIDDGVLVAIDDARRRESLDAFAARRDAPIEAHADARAGPEAERYATRSFGAVFAEVRVDASLGLIRVPRIVATYSIGRLLNA